MTRDEAIEEAGRIRYRAEIGGGSFQEIRDMLARNGLKHLDAKSLVAEYNVRRVAAGKKPYATDR